jgi:hypothetical protein
MTRLQMSRPSQHRHACATLFFTAGSFVRARALLQRHRICTANRFLNVSTVLCLMSTMSPYNCERQAQAAMSMALAATGCDRQKWVRIAVAWYHLARSAPDHDRALTPDKDFLQLKA